MSSDTFFIIQSECHRQRIKALKEKLNFESFRNLVLSELERLKYRWASNESTAVVIESYYNNFL